MNVVLMSTDVKTISAFFLEIKPKIKQFWAIFKREYTFVAYEMLHTLCLFSITCIIQGV